MSRNPCICFDPDCPGIPLWQRRLAFWSFLILWLLAGYEGARFVMALAVGFARS